MGPLHLYIDDSGTRQTDRHQGLTRTDGIDHFALGGILVRDEHIGAILNAHNAFISRWGITEPLHSTKIRGRRAAFSWLRKDASKEAEFLSELEGLVIGLPIIGIGCVIDRPGYVARYADRYGRPWLLCKTAFAILMERAAKYAIRQGTHLEVYFEEAGRGEDRDLLSYQVPGD